MNRRVLLLLVAIALGSVDGLANPTKQLSRRAALWTGLLLPTSVQAVTILNEDGEYVEVSEDDWQTTWKSRLDKASDMDSVFMAARGAGNVDPQSDAARKRRAMAGCRDATTVKKTNLDQKACTAKVLNGELDFILDVM